MPLPPPPPLGVGQVLSVPAKRGASLPILPPIAKKSPGTDLSGQATSHIPFLSIHGLQATRDTLRVKPCWSTKPLVTMKAMDNLVGLSHSYKATVQ